MTEYKNRVAEYLRKSRSDDNLETVDQTLSRHHQALIKYAEKNNIVITKTYKEVVSGDGLFTRPQMISMLNEISNGLYTAVLCMDIDRLGRSSTKDSGIIMETLRDNNCRIITPEKVYNLSDEIDEMTVELKSFFARQELKAIRKRLKRGETATLSAGGHTGAVPYGYKRIRIGKTPSLEPYAEQAEIVKMIYEYYIDGGIGTYLIAQKLNSMGILSPGGGLWSRSSVRMILKNPIYKGDIIWNRTKTVKRKYPTDKYRQINNDETEWITAHGLHQPLVSENDFKMAQSILNSRSVSTKFTGTVKNPYSGLLYCANCGKPIQRQLVRGTERIICTNKSCTSSIPMEAINYIIKDLLKRIFSDIKILPSYHIDNDNKILSQIKTLQTRLIQLDRQENGLCEFLENGIYDIATYSERKKVLTARKDAIRKESAILNERLNQHTAKNICQHTPSPEVVINELEAVEPAALNTALKRIIDRIEYKRVRQSGYMMELEIWWKI